MKHKDQLPSRDVTLISVVIPTYNRAESLRDTLSDLAQQVTEGKFTYEVIVVDNNSNDSTQEIVQGIAETYPVALTYLFEPRQGRSCALNAGITHSSADVIAITDDDVRLGSNWLQVAVDTFERHNADGVGGPLTPLWIGSRPSWLSDQIVRQLGITNFGTAPFVVTSPRTVFVGANGAYRRGLFIDLGGFDEERILGCSEDTEWFLRVFNTGRRLVYQPAMVVQHKVDVARWTKRKIARRFFRQGRSCAFGLQEGGNGLTICRIPPWVIRFYASLHWLALKCWFLGSHEEALWHWLRRYFYLGTMYYCFMDWIKQRPKQRSRPKILSQVKKRQEAFLIVPPRSSEAGTTRNASARK